MVRIKIKIFKNVWIKTKKKKIYMDLNQTLYIL